MGITERFKGQRCDKNTVEQSIQDVEIPETCNDECEDFSLYSDIQSAPSPDVILPQYSFLDVVEPYLSDLSITKIVIVNNLVKIYRDDVFSESLTVSFPVSPSGTNGVAQFIHRDFVVSVVAPPVCENICATFEKIRFLSPSDLVRQKFVTEKTFDFVAKAVKNRKNIIIVDNVQLFNTICAHCLGICGAVLFQELPTIKESEKVTVFNINELTENECSTLLQVTKSLNPDYLLSNVNNEGVLSSILTKTQDRNGKIIALDSPCANTALYKILNMIMISERCNEKIAKSKLLNGFHYIIDNSGIYLIAPAKTAILTLKEIV